MNNPLSRLIIIAIALFAATLGCNSAKPLPLQEQFTMINVAQTDASEVLNLLPEKGMLHTTDAISAYNKKGWARELAIVLFNSEDSLVKRKDYIQTRSQITVPPFTAEKMYLQVQTLIPQDILDEPYESDMRKHAAILQYCQNAVIADVKPFQQDEKTAALMGMARSALREAIVNLDQRPRDAYLLLEPKGFDFSHSVMGKSRLKLIQNKENIFTLHLQCTDTVDPPNVW